MMKALAAEPQKIQPPELRISDFVNRRRPEGRTVRTSSDKLDDRNRWYVEPFSPNQEPANDDSATSFSAPPSHSKGVAIDK